jgi:hypothetical protein
MKNKKRRQLQTARRLNRGHNQRQLVRRRNASCPVNGGFVHSICLLHGNACHVDNIHILILIGIGVVIIVIFTSIIKAHRLIAVLLTRGDIINFDIVARLGNGVNHAIVTTVQ